MPAERVAMRDVRVIIRLKFLSSLTTSEIARRLEAAARERELDWGREVERVRRHVLDHRPLAGRDGEDTQVTRCQRYLRRGDSRSAFERRGRPKRMPRHSFATYECLLLVKCQEFSAGQASPTQSVWPIPDG